MNKLTAEQIKMRAAHVANLRRLASAARAAVAELNKGIESASEFRNEIAGKIEDEISVRSEKSASFENSERGQEFAAWKEEWEAAVLDAVDIDDLLKEAADVLDALPSEPVEEGEE